MKAVLASLKPFWYYLVGEGIKSIEVRKTFPKAEDWSKDTFFYMSRDEKSFAEIPKELQEKYRKHFGKVGLRFVCDRIDEYRYGVYDGEFCYHIPTVEGEKTCLEYDEAEEYGSGKPLYFWHISNLVIYDKPRELREFRKPSLPTGLRYEDDTITRPPQSYMYCEEVNNGT